MKFLKRRRQDQEQTCAKYLLHKEMAAMDPHRGVDLVHASDVTKQDNQEFCPREFAICRAMNKTPDPMFITTSLRWTFDTGWFVQDYVTRKLTPYIWGDWRCRACTQVHHAQKKPTECIECGSDLIEYEEMRFKSKISDIDCGVDLLLDTGEGKFRAYEIKSIKQDLFKKLVAPQHEHKLRTNLYLRIIEESGSANAEFIDTTSASILYVCKGFGCKDTDPSKWGLKDGSFSPFREFDVERDDCATDELVRRAVALKSQRMPDFLCESQFCPRAQSCSVQTECFGGQFPHEK